MNTIICDLQPQQVHTFYEAVGLMISAQTDQTGQALVGDKCDKYMALPNQVWDDIILQATRVSFPNVVKNNKRQAEYEAGRY